MNEKAETGEAAPRGMRLARAVTPGPLHFFAPIRNWGGPVADRHAVQSGATRPSRFAPPTAIPFLPPFPYPSLP